MYLTHSCEKKTFIVPLFLNPRCVYCESVQTRILTWQFGAECLWQGLTLALCLCCLPGLGLWSQRCCVRLRPTCPPVLNASHSRAPLWLLVPVS